MPASVPGIGGQHGWYVGDDPNPDTGRDEYRVYNLRSGRYLEIWRASSGPMDADTIMELQLKKAPRHHSRGVTNYCSVTEIALHI